MKRKPVKCKFMTLSNHPINSMYSRMNRVYRPQTDGVVGLEPERYDDDLDEVTVEREEE